MLPRTKRPTWQKGALPERPDWCAPENSIGSSWMEPGEYRWTPDCQHLGKDGHQTDEPSWYLCCRYPAGGLLLTPAMGCI